MTRVVVLDSTPLGLLCGPPARPDVPTARQWRDALVMAGHRLVIPEVIDYEVRRELLRANKSASVARLTALRAQLEYLPLGTAAMETPAELWAAVRRRGLPTAPDRSLDIDVILAAQAELLAAPATVIATSNVAHLVRFHPADFWSTISP